MWVCEKDSRSTLFINFVKYAHTIQQQKERISNKHQTRLRSAGERERERERRSSSGSDYVQVAVAVAVHFPFRSPSLPACPATWNWNFPALECSCSVLLLLLLGRLCCTRTSPSSTDKQQAEQHTHTKVEGDVQTKRKEWRKNTLAKGHGIGEWELILFSSFSAAASSSPRLLACVMLCVVFFFCLPYAFVYRPVFGFVCFCVLHMRFFRSFGLFFTFACAALSQRRWQRRDSRARGSIIAACLHVLSLSSSHSLLWPRGRHIPWVCLPVVLLNVN